jgi:hypothetical protein
VTSVIAVSTAALPAAGAKANAIRALKRARRREGAIAACGGERCVDRNAKKKQKPFNKII